MIQYLITMLSIAAIAITVMHTRHDERPGKWLVADLTPTLTTLLR